MSNDTNCRLAELLGWHVELHSGETYYDPFAGEEVTHPDYYVMMPPADAPEWAWFWDDDEGEKCGWQHKDREHLWATYTPRFDENWAAMAWAWEQVMGDVRWGGNKPYSEVIFDKNDAKKHYAVIFLTEGSLFDDTYQFFEGQGITELEARCACLIAVLEGWQSTQEATQEVALDTEGGE